jgi:hypothetical protein
MERDPLSKQNLDQDEGLALDITNYMVDQLPPSVRSVVGAKTKLKFIEILKPYAPGLHKALFGEEVLN